MTPRSTKGDWTRAYQGGQAPGGTEWSLFGVGRGSIVGRFSVGPVVEQLAILEEALCPEGVDHVLSDGASLVVGSRHERFETLPKLPARHVRKRAPGIAGDEELQHASGGLWVVR